MDRFTISLDEALARQFDELIAERGYRNRSEAVRDLIRAALLQQSQRGQPTGDCVANVSYVYNHHQREMAERLTGLQHHHHALTVASLHSHLDEEACIESVILKGPTGEVRRFADALMAESGVRHGQVNLIALADGPSRAHSHPHSHPHEHEHPKAPELQAPAQPDPTPTSSAVRARG